MAQMFRFGGDVQNETFLRVIDKNKNEAGRAYFASVKPCGAGICDSIMLGLSGCTLLLLPCRYGYCSSCMRAAGCWCPFSGTYIFWAVYYKNLKAVQVFHRLGSDLDARLLNGETLLQYAEKYQTSPEILEYLKHARGAPTVMSMERDGNKVLEVLGAKHKRYVCFLSHHKRDAAAIVTTLRTGLANRLNLDPSYVFLDSEDLRDLRGLRESVKSSLAVVVFLTKDVLTRPWCLVEIITAIECQIPIVTIHVEGQGDGYDFASSVKFMQTSNFRDQLEALNPGAAEELERQDIDVNRMAQAIGSILPFVIAKPYNVAATERVREAQLNDIVDVLLEKVA